MARRECIDSTAHTHLVHQEVREAIDRLPPEQRELVIARLWGGLTLQESAELCNCLPLPFIGVIKMP